MKDLFFVPFAFHEEKSTGVNVKGNALDTYLKNLCVSLISARKMNPNVDVALVTNMQIPAKYEKLLEENRIQIFIEPFDTFLFADNYTWCLAFYKLCALEKMVTKYDYDRYIYTDADIFVQNPLDQVFLELKDHILLYDINHGLAVNDYRIIVEEFNRFGIDALITHYGGEFFGANRENAKVFLEECKKIFAQMQSENFATTKGDEFILSIAAYRLRQMVKNAGAYIFRFWTGSFYLVSTCFRYNEVSILHLPSEKGKGMLKLYDYFVKKQAFPSKEKVHKICHLTHQPLACWAKNQIKKLLKK